MGLPWGCKESIHLRLKHLPAYWDTEHMVASFSHTEQTCDVYYYKTQRPWQIITVCVNI